MPKFKKLTEEERVKLKTSARLILSLVGLTKEEILRLRGIKQEKKYDLLEKTPKPMGFDNNGNLIKEP